MEAGAEAVDTLAKSGGPDDVFTLRYTLGHDVLPQGRDDLAPELRPSEIEAFLMSHPAVEQAFVVGVPDPETNEAPVAYVILRPAARLGEDELRAFCRGRIASFKIPRAVRFVDDVPRTPGPHGDKVQKGKLREQALARAGIRPAVTGEGLEEFPGPAGQCRPRARGRRGRGADGGGERRHRRHGVPGDRAPERTERGPGADGAGGGGAPRAADRPGPGRRRRRMPP